MACNSALPWYEGYYESCDQCSVASLPNVVYQPNGCTVCGTSHHRILNIGSNGMTLYGIVDGFNDGQDVANFVADQLVTEIFPLTQSDPHIMNKEPSDSDIKTLLCQTFKLVDNAYFSDYIGETLTRRFAQQIGTYYQSDTKDIDSQISGFATALVALTYNNKFYIANLGDSKAVLVKKVKSKWDVFQMGDWHHPSDPIEEKRLRDLGINPNDVEPPTRCFGDFFRKWNYKEVPSLCMATGAPVSAEVSVHGSYSLDETMRFLILMNGGVVQTIMESDRKSSIESKFADLIAEYSTEPLSGLAKSILDTLAREHQKAFTNGLLHPRSVKKRRDLDMLIIRLSKMPADRITPSLPLMSSEATLEHEIKEDVDGSSKQTVQSYVDFSVINTHPLSQEVLRNIAEIKRRYKDLETTRLNDVAEEEIQF